VNLRVLSYNVHGLRDDRRALRELIGGAEPDVVILQEAPRRLRWRTRCATLARDVGLVYAAGGGPSLGNVILTSHRVRVRETWCLRFPLTPGRHLRGAVFARCGVGDTGFVVAGAHLATDPDERGGQAARLAQALTAAAGGGAALILGADLNEAPGGPVWQHLDRSLRDAAGPDARPTFPAAAPARRIDALLVDPDIRVESCRVLDGPLAQRASDHLALLADLAIPARVPGPGDNVRSFA
jgi:endonuclease/exonuclease/phosphatase family metal-dependent hydrolase